MRSRLPLLGPLLLAAPVLMITSCATMNAEPAARTLATAALATADGTPVGTAQLMAQGEAVMLKVSGMAMPPGEHGIHLHMVGRCDAPGFTTAGAHLNPAMKLHGTMNPEGPHLGDLPNIVAAADGAATYSAPLPGTPAEVMAGIADADGTTLIVHAAADDYRTDPSGNSGGRIACGVVTPS